MTKRRIIIFLSLLLATLTILTIRANLDIPFVAQKNNKLLISAAASLRESLQEIQLVYPHTKQNANVTYNFGASGALQQQIENGAPADVFISASKKQMDALQEKGLILSDTRRNLLTNRLVLIVPRNSSEISNFRQLTNAKVKKIAVGEPRSVPAGQYAEQVFINLGILQQIKPKFVLGNNVRQVLAAVESGNVDAGVVYATDARTSQQVKQVATAAENLHSPIVYPVAVLKNSKNISAAKEYIQFLFSNQARTLFQKYGFGI
ncbi:molybdate ABC transporter substrate-binding protein [Cyanobacteria bacterium FACHB-472]|nr:molybdate ABC transporter substrate-binding protein [Cyanobacteria bacterium FACHB-472]